jgi:hypothetical protein
MIIGELIAPNEEQKYSKISDGEQIQAPFRNVSASDQDIAKNGRPDQRRKGDHHPDIIGLETIS